MNIELLLTLIGSFISMGLVINAFFLKSILSDINQVKVSLARIEADSIGKEHRITSLENDNKTLEKRMNKLERECTNGLCKQG